MRGFPKNINTRQDVENLLSTHPGEVRAFLRRCVAEAENWIHPILLGDGDEGVEDATHAMRIDEDGARYQMTWGFDPGCKLARLGYTIEEAEVIING